MKEAIYTKKISRFTLNFALYTHDFACSTMMDVIYTKISAGLHTILPSE
jgi:hypothetical protein